MRAGEFVSEIQRMPQQSFTGGKEALDIYNPKLHGNLKTLPGSSGLKYHVQYLDQDYSISIVDTAAEEPEIIGQLDLSHTSNFPLKNAHQVDNITVDEQRRGQGIAKALYGIYLNIIKQPLIAGSMQTPGGRKNWMSLSAIPGVDVMGYVSVADRDFDFPDNSAAFGRLLSSLMAAGVEYLGSTGSGVGRDRWFLFPVVPGRSEMQPAVKKTLSLYTGSDRGTNTGLMARWKGK